MGLVLTRGAAARVERAASILDQGGEGGPVDAIFCPRAGAVTILEGHFCNGTTLGKGDGVRPSMDKYNVLYNRPCQMVDGCAERFAAVDIRQRFPVQEIFEPEIGS